MHVCTQMLQYAATVTRAHVVQTMQARYAQQLVKAVKYAVMDVTALQLEVLQRRYLFC